MSGEEISKHDQVLAGLVMSLQAAALQQMGKFKNPLTDQLERDLEQARRTIDILEMLKAKCRQGTHEQILRLLDSSVMELQMNYLDEVNKASTPTRAPASDEAAEAEADVDPDGSRTGQPEAAAGEDAGKEDGSGE